MTDRRLNRILRDTTSIQRGIIRHVYLVIDLSACMLEREFKSSWLDLALQYSKVRPPLIFATSSAGADLYTPSGICHGVL